MCEGHVRRRRPNLCRGRTRPPLVRTHQGDLGRRGDHGRGRGRLVRTAPWPGRSGPHAGSVRRGRSCCRPRPVGRRCPRDLAKRSGPKETRPYREDLWSESRDGAPQASPEGRGTDTYSTCPRASNGARAGCNGARTACIRTTRLRAGRYGDVRPASPSRSDASEPSELGRARKAPGTDRRSASTVSGIAGADDSSHHSASGVGGRTRWDRCGRVSRDPDRTAGGACRTDSAHYADTSSSGRCTCGGGPRRRGSTALGGFREDRLPGGDARSLDGVGRRPRYRFDQAGRDPFSLAGAPP